MTIALTAASHSSPTISRDAIRHRLEEARARTLLLIETVSEADLLAQHDALMGPILWDLGHIAHFEALWLERNLDGKVEFVEMPGMYNPFEYPRRVRGTLPLPSLAATLATMAEIRERVLERLERVNFESVDPLVQNGYVYEMVLQHEYQHNETMLQTLQLKLGAPFTPALRRSIPRPATPYDGHGDMVRVDVREAWIGTDDRTHAYDNERPRIRITPKAYWIDRTPVTNGAFIAFIEDGAYRRPELWSEAGRLWLNEARPEAPKYWWREGGSWMRRSMDQIGQPEPDAPVIHVCYHEAEAFARWAGKRLPTEAEWEVAAGWDPSSNQQRTYAWGDVEPNDELANLDQLGFDVAPIGAYPRNVSPSGCYGMIGDVWEWTSTDFGGYHGFTAFPYREYSEVFFGNDYKVLRGGAWATRPGAVRNTFRNWDLPIRRQIFSGFRCARDA
jgi:gamma-glutamyl hercynylcysteine S-oxide synthase